MCQTRLWSTKWRLLRTVDVRGWADYGLISLIIIKDKQGDVNDQFEPFDFIIPPWADKRVQEINIVTTRRSFHDNGRSAVNRVRTDQSSSLMSALEMMFDWWHSTLQLTCVWLLGLLLSLGSAWTCPSPAPAQQISLDPCRTTFCSIIGDPRPQKCNVSSARIKETPIKPRLRLYSVPEAPCPSVLYMEANNSCTSALFHVYRWKVEKQGEPISA